MITPMFFEMRQCIHAGGKKDMERSDFDKVRASVAEQCGSRVEIRLDRGRNMVDIQTGVIKEAYPSVFTIEVDGEKNTPDQLLSFSYTDIITKDIRMRLC
jgi:uncharacterized protein Veg